MDISDKYKNQKFSEIISQSHSDAELYLKTLSLNDQKTVLNFAAGDFVYWHSLQSPNHLKWTLEQGANIHHHPSYGKSLIHWLFSGHSSKELLEETLDVLLEFGADIECKTTPPDKDASLDPFHITKGQTPILVCAHYGNLMGAEALLARGANLTAKNDGGKGFLDVIEERLPRYPRKSSAVKILDWFLQTKEGSSQMRLHMSDTHHREAFLSEIPDFTLGWLATNEQRKLSEDLPNGGLNKPGVRL